MHTTLTLQQSAEAFDATAQTTLKDELAAFLPGISAVEIALTINGAAAATRRRLQTTMVGVTIFPPTAALAASTAAKLEAATIAELTTAVTAPIIEKTAATVQVVAFDAPSPPPPSPPANVIDPDQNPTTPGGGGSDDGKLIGGVVGGVLGAIVLLALMWFCCWRTDPKTGRRMSIMTLSGPHGLLPAQRSVRRPKLQPNPEGPRQPGVHRGRRRAAGGGGGWLEGGRGCGGGWRRVSRG